MVAQPPHGSGWIEVICGPMFSGKTEELIRRLRRAEIAEQPTQAFKPKIDDRYGTQDVVSHNQRKADAIAVASSDALLAELSPQTQVVGIDEVQFFDGAVVALAETLANRGLRVIIAGLDTDFRGQPFVPMPALMAQAEYVTKLLAICNRCGNPASRSRRTDGGAEQVEVGAAQQYVALCRACYAKAAHANAA